MGKGRVEAFSDGVIAIIITIMVLDLKVPHGVQLADLKPVLPVFLSYVLSFVYVGIYWNNHHHLFQGAKTVNGAILWANLHLLFWLSTVPFVTSWMGENPLAVAPVALYGVVLLMSAIAFSWLAWLLVRHEGLDSDLAKALGRNIKSRISLTLYALGIAVTFVQPLAALGCYVAVALIWFIPDRRVERQLSMHEGA